jgi:glycosyltransferase involved in cell wall biosynthesis
MKNISIIVTSYNYGRYLRQAIDSALRQECLALEVIVVDDGSTDDSVEIIKSYGSSIIPICKANGGQSSSLNAAIEIARGDWVLLLDSDDILSVKTLSRLGTIEPGPKCSRVQYYLQIVDQDGNLQNLCHSGERLKEGNLRRETLQTGMHGGPPTSGNVYNRQALKKILPIPEEEFRIGPDCYLSIGTNLQGDVLVIPEILGGYRVHQKNSYGAVGAENYLRSRYLFRRMLRNASNQLSPRLGESLEKMGEDNAYLWVLVLLDIRLHGNQEFYGKTCSQVVSGLFQAVIRSRRMQDVKEIIRGLSLWIWPGFGLQFLVWALGFKNAPRRKTPQELGVLINPLGTNAEAL